MSKQDIIDVYELSPMQQGMLFHTLYNPRSGVYFEQRSCLISGELNTQAFKQAWKQVITRHSVLRTAFYWEELEKPLQVVYSQADLPFIEENWQHLTPNEQQNKLEYFLTADREKGFEVDQAPLMRCALFQVQENTYQFVWSHHHLLMDGWCNGLIIKEVLAFYEAFKQGQNLSLTPPRPYREYISWLQQQDLSQAKIFWNENLKGLTTPTPLTVENYQNTEDINTQEYLQFTPRETLELKSFCQQHYLTLNTLIQGAWALLLSRYSCESDVVFGATVSGRPPTLPGVESIVGLFINTLPVRVKLNPQIQLVSWLQTLQTQQIERDQYAYTSLIDIQKWSNIPTGTPLFDSLLVFENYPVSLDTVLNQSNSTLKISQTWGFEKTNYPLALFVLPNSELLFRIDYNKSRFLPKIIQQILRHLKVLLLKFLSNPKARLFELSLLSPSDQHKLLIEWNKTKTEFEHQAFIHQLFEAQVQQTPDAIAVADEDQQLTYKTLNYKANQLAHYLHELGIKSEELIGICLERSCEMLIALLAVLKAGSAYVPLDPSYPQERLFFIIKDAKISLLLTESKLLNNKLNINKVINLDEQWKLIAPQSSKNIDFKITPQNLAYVIYTSGSTGQPKGVEICHYSLTNFLIAMRQNLGLLTQDILLSVTTLSFDIAALELYLPIIVGARLMIVSREVATDGVALREQINLSNATLMQATPATWRMLIACEWTGNKNLKVLCGGEALDYHLAQQLLQNSQQVWNLYGPTETTIWSAIYPLNLSYFDQNKLTYISIGRPLANTQFYVLDSQFNPVPIGVKGELYIAGLGVARGYLNRPELTAKRFIPNPFSTNKAQQNRLYKTGDIVRYLPDGNIEYLGRLDHQVKIRGFRIELGEIEAALSDYQNIQEAIVVVRSEETGDQRLIVYYTHQHISQESEKKAITTQELRLFLEDKLPRYMIPSIFVELEAFPLTPNGKVDRRALVAIEHKLPTTQKIKPQTPVEEILVGIWENILNRQGIKITQNFFELGGHSLLATRVVSQIRQIFKIEFPLRYLFDFPTISELAQEINRLTKNQLKSPIASIQPISRSSDLPLSFAQQRQWFLSQFEPNNPFYNIPIAIELKGTLNINIIKQIFSEVIRRHEVLRTAFQTLNGKPKLVISERSELQLPIIDLSELNETQQQLQTHQFLLTESLQYFDLNVSPLLRTNLLRFNDKKHLLILTIHHIISDGWSISLLLHELSTLYQAFLNQKPSPLEELPIQYVDFANWQRQWLQGELLENQLSYWRQQLQNAPTLSELPTDRIRPSVQTSQGASYTFKIPQQQLEALKILSQQSGSTLFITLLTAFYTLIHRYTGNEDIIIGSPIANRNRSEIEKLIGFFVNTLALRVNLSNNPTFEELLQRVRQVSLDAYAHQDIPFEQLLEQLNIPRSLSYTPLFQIMFFLQNAPLKTIEISDLSWNPIDIPRKTAKFDLTLLITETDEQLIGSFEYNTNLFEANTISRLAEHFHNLLEAIIANPEQNISEFNLLNQDEEKQVIVKWNQTQTNYPREACIHKLFEQQVKQYPDAIALTYNDQQLTYQELNIRSNKIAHYLLKNGTKTDQLIGICMERSMETFVSILGILKAGGAYVFLDPGYPQQRLEYILKDTLVSVIITNTNNNYFEALNIPTLNIEKDWQILNQENSNNPIHQVTAENLAYVMYTSGSTGKPKGVCIPHRGVVRLVQDSNYVHLNTKEIFLQAAQLSFDASTFEIWGALLNGGRMVILPIAQPSLNELGEIIEQYNITTIWLTAGLFHLMVAQQIECFKNVRQLLAGGDVLSSVYIQKVLQKFPSCKLINGYGPTESTTFACCCSIENIAQINQSVPIGYPISNTQVYVLDRYLYPVPVGVPGELYIGGDGLARGYLNRPELTAEKFIPNPFNSKKSSDRLYKTGDLVRYLSDGTLEYLGRLDNQVKVRGFRIEIGEIEAVLTQHSTVKDVAVITTEDQTGNKRLIAYIVLDKNDEAVKNQSYNILSQLRSFLAEKLPDYMIPALLISIDSLPLTVNGKVDYRALSKREIIQPEPQSEFVNPHSEIELKLAEIWSEIIQIERVGIHDNFFEIGGDSILAIQIISKASKVGIQLTPKQIFQAQTIAELAAIATVDKTINSEQGLIIGSVPLTPIQHWFFENHKQDIYHFNQAILLEVKQSIDIAILEKTIQQLLIHHDALRLQFEQTELGWKQTITYPNSEIPLTYFDLSNLPEPQQNQALEFTVNEVHKSLNLLTGSLVRVALLNLGCERGYRLLFVIHHLAVDGLSWRILLEDFQTIYEQLKNNQKLYLSLKTTSLKQWSDALQEYANSDLIQQERNYWLTIITQETDSLPLDCCRGKNTVQASETVTISLSLEKTKALLKDIPSAYNTHINDILLTALTQTISNWTEQNYLVVDLENHGRESILNNLNLSRTVGWFTSIFPVRLELNKATNLGEAIKTIKEQLRKVPNSVIGYGILRYLAPSESTIPNSKAEICFNYLGQFDQMFSSSIMNLASESSGQARSSQQTRCYLLEINGLIIERKLQFHWIYSKNFHHPTTIEKLAISFQKTLEQLIIHCCSPEAGGYTPSDFSLAQFDQDQLDQVLDQIEF